MLSGTQALYRRAIVLERTVVRWDQRMSVYLIALHEQSTDVQARLKTTWPSRHHFVTDTLAFVAPEGITTAVDVAKEVGMTDAEDVMGFVVAMDDYSGRSWEDAVRWLEKARV